MKEGRIMPGRREEEYQTIGIPPGHGGGRKREEHPCRCAHCGWELSIEEGEKCNAIMCPICGSKMADKK